MAELRKTLQQHFPPLSDGGLLGELEEESKIMRMPEGEELMNIGNYISAIPLVTKGALKITRLDDEGNELFLYYIYPGQSCAITLSSCLGNAPSQVRAVSEENTELILVPVRKLEYWLTNYPGWKNFVMQTYHQRFNEMLKTIDSIAFTQLDQRLMRFLKEKANAGNNYTIAITHQKIADNMNSTREVVSRLLKQLEQKGQIKTGRNKITLL